MGRARGCPACCYQGCAAETTPVWLVRRLRLRGCSCWLPLLLHLQLSFRLPTRRQRGRAESPEA
jgi:hypothetical protein